MNTLDQVAAVLAKAEAGGVHGAELAALRRRLRQLDEHKAGRLPGDVLEPLPDLPRVDELPEPSPGLARDVLSRLVVVKLNGGLGTGMGLSGPKSLLEVNHQTVDPSDPASTPVIQLESAMGAAIGSIRGARAIHVPARGSPR